MTAGDPFTKGAFTWLFGIEDTCVYPVEEGVQPLDEHVLTEHSDNWRADLTLARDLGATAIRYGVSWPLVHVAPDEYDWAVLDEVIPFAVDVLGLTIVADLVHYGTPRWLVDSFADTGYSKAIQDFAGAFAARYRTRVSHFTPLNEPVTTASFCGLRGIWPPALSGWSGWVAVAIPMALGIVRSITAIRQVNPGATIIHVEAATVVDASDPLLDGHAELLRGIGWLPTDLITGMVTPVHPLWAWLISHGAVEDDLRWLIENPAIPDLIGVNYYPDLTPRSLERVDGAIVQVSYDYWTKGLSQAIEAFAARYRLPIVITETSIEGDDELRSRWVHDSVHQVRALLNGGADIRGYTWWPLLDFVDWSWAAGGSNVEEFVVARTTVGGGTEVGPAPSLGNPSEGKSAFLRRMGLVRLEEQEDRSLKRVTTSAAAQFTRASRETMF